MEAGGAPFKPSTPTPSPSPSPLPTRPVSVSGEPNPQTTNNPNLMTSSSISPPSASYPPPTGGGGSVPYSLRFRASPFHRHIPEYSGPKLPKGRRLIDDHILYCIDARLPGEEQPQLEAMRAFKYVPDTGLVLGRQIAVNRPYICYRFGPKF